MVFRLLHSIYRYAPAPLRKVIIGVSPLARLILSPFVSRVAIGNGATMFLDAGDNACFRYLKWGEDYEKTTVSALRQLANGPGRKIFFDVGAAYGFYSLSLAATVPAERLERIYAFEPDERGVTALNKSVAHNRFDRLTVERAIVGDVEGTANLLVSHRASTSNRSFQTDEVAFTTARSVAVRALSIDTYFTNRPTDYIALMKIDVEGNEARVLRGAMDTLRQARGWAIQFEFFPVGMAEVHQSRDALSALCAALAPDWVYVERQEQGRMERLNGLPGLFADMASHKDTPDYRGLGTAANYIIGRGIAPL